ncbi:MAG: DUF3574 domain-containing protein [Bryobacteraceae bacterium]|nr:DUF3574 domain-containing protein [Bryobacteraceae bacterium]
MKPFPRRTLFGLPIPFLAATATSQAAASSVRPKSAEVWQETQLYFGTSQPRGAVVTDREFTAFIDMHVTPRFPDGLTLLGGYGQFRGESGTINKEKSLVLILFYPPSMTDANAKIEEIRELYKMQFAQESVLRADRSAAISF